MLLALFMASDPPCLFPPEWTLTKTVAVRSFVARFVVVKPTTHLLLVFSVFRIPLFVLTYACASIQADGDFSLSSSSCLVRAVVVAA